MIDILIKEAILYFIEEWYEIGLAPVSCPKVFMALQETWINITYFN